MINIKEATKYFKVHGNVKYILKDISINIPTDKNIAILGRNGAGKSTLLRMLGGIDHPNSGSIESDKTFSWPMGISGGLQGSMTGRQNVRFISMIYGKSSDETDQIIQSVIDFSELGEYFDLPIKTYSSGMKSKLNLGISLSFDFDYYLIDELMSVGDEYFKTKSKQAIVDKIANKKIIMVSHSMNYLREFCTASIVLHNGEIFYYNDVETGINMYKKINT